LNSGPGSIAGIFVHEKYFDLELLKFEGWWGNKRENRFKLKTDFDSSMGAASFQLSNP
jgi:kynureninase